MGAVYTMYSGHKQLKNRMKKLTKNFNSYICFDVLSHFELLKREFLNKFSARKKEWTNNFECNHVSLKKNRSWKIKLKYLSRCYSLVECPFFNASTNWSYVAVRFLQNSLDQTGRRPLVLCPWATPPSSRQGDLILANSVPYFTKPKNSDPNKNS